MKRSLLLLSLLCVLLISSTAFAGQLWLAPNSGWGSNFAYHGQMNGHPLSLFGGTPDSFFSSLGYEPGSTFGGGAPLYLYSAEIWIDGVPLWFDFPSNDASITISPIITLPTEGEGFTDWVAIDFSAVGINYDTGQTIGVGGGAAGKIMFFLAPESGMYRPSEFVQTPEPATLGLVGMGIIGMLGSIRKRLKRT